eukprot:scaffold9015_cov60-Phaeocystis_antarctica.AAC.7
MPLPVERRARHQESVSSYLWYLSLPAERASGPPVPHFGRRRQPRQRSWLTAAVRNGERPYRRAGAPRRTLCRQRSLG